MDSPGKKAMEVMNINQEIIFKKPIGIPRKKPKEKILDEDSYVEVIFDCHYSMNLNPDFFLEYWQNN